MVSTYTPAREVRSVLIDALRADTATHDLLFPVWAEQVGPDDLRAYDAHAELPTGPIRTALPRLMLDVRWQAHDLEQEGDNLHGPVMVTLYGIVPRAHKEHGEALIARAVRVLLSTQLSGARIIAANLYQTTAIVPAERLESFDGAWQYRCEFRSADVEVLV